MGSPIGIVITRIARASLEVPSVLFEPGTDLYGLCVWHYTLIYKADFFQIHICWWRRIYSLSLTPFSETYELRGYVVEGYPQYTLNLVTWHAKCCCVMIIVWSFVIWSFVWSFIFVIITLIICWPKAWLCTKAWLCGRNFVERHTPEWSKQERWGKVMRGRSL